MLITFVRYGNGETAILKTAEELLAAWEQDKAQLWVDALEPTHEELAVLKRLVPADNGTWDDSSVEDEPHPRLDEHETFVFLLLYGAVGIVDSDELRPRKLAIFMGARFLFTVHHEPLRTIQTMTQRYQKKPSMILKNGVAAMLHDVVDQVTDYYETWVDSFQDRLDNLEVASLARKIPEHFLIQLLPLRRQMLELRRLASAQRELLTPLAYGECDYISTKIGRRIRHVRDHLTMVSQKIDGLREMLQGIRDNYHAAMSARTNADMKRLTMVATILLPLTLIAGVYGMNLRVWPASDSRYGFWLVLLGMMGLAAALLYVFRKRRWL